MRGWVSAWLACVVLTLSHAARAEPTDEQRALASSLFDQGKTLMAAGKTAEGCRKLEASERVVPLPGTLLNLAVCHEREGKLASAMGEFREARALAVRDGRDDRVTLADQRLATIAPHVSKLIVVVAPSTDVPGLQIECDGTRIDRAVWGAPVPVDPGERHVTASAPGKKERSLVVNIGGDGDVQSVVIEPLSAAPKPFGPLSAGPPSVEARPAPSRWTSRRIAGLLLGSAGVVTLGVGSGFGIHAISVHNDPNAVCTTIPCEPDTIRANDDARRSANVATTAFTIGLVALAAGFVLWLTSK
jgi:hypothetical protein